MTQARGDLSPNGLLLVPIDLAIIPVVDRWLLASVCKKGVM